MNTKEVYNIATGKSPMPVDKKEEKEQQSAINEANYFNWRKDPISIYKVSKIELKLGEILDAAMGQAMLNNSEDAVKHLIRAHSYREILTELKSKV